MPREAVADPFTACVAFAEVAVGGLLLDRAHHSPGQFLTAGFCGILCIRLFGACACCHEHDVVEELAAAAANGVDLALGTELVGVSAAPATGGGDLPACTELQLRVAAPAGAGPQEWAHPLTVRVRLY